MRIYDSQEIAGWAAERGLDLEVAWRECEAAEGSPGYRFPVDSGEKTGLASLIAGLCRTDEAVLWVTLTDVWPSSANPFLFQMLRRAAGEERPLDQAPYHVFGPEDQEWLWTFVSVCLYLIWEGLLVAGSGALSVFIDHDERLWVAGRDADRVSAARRLLDEFGLERRVPTENEQ